MTAAPTANYLLVDGVMMPQAYNTVLHTTGIEDLVPLYLGTPWAEMKQLGPLLVKLAPGAQVLEQALAGTHDWPTRASLLFSPVASHVLARHLRRFIAPKDIHGGTGLLRFSDPLVTRHWLASYEGQALDNVLGPIEAWDVVDVPHAWLPREAVDWRSFRRISAAMPWLDSYAQLGQGQLDALGRAGRWRFIERLYANLQEGFPEYLARLDNSTLAAWFEARIEEAQGWGVSSDRSVAIWIEYSLRWGDGFTQRLNEPYQQWLARTPDAQKLLPELRIRQMDRDCLTLDLHKDAL